METAVKDYSTLIEKEEISEFFFPKGEVLDSEIKKEELKSQITRAMQLGNGAKRKVKIIFEDTEGLKKVETTVWGFTDKNVILKKTIIIPTRCIHEIKFY